MPSYVSQRENPEPLNAITNNAMVVALTIAVSLLLLSLVSYFLFAPIGKGLNILVPVTALAVALVGILLVWRGRAVSGITLSLAGMAASYIFFINSFGGVGILAAIVFTLVVVSTIKETFPQVYVARIATLALVAGLLMLLLDLFWPGPKRSPLPRELAPLVIIAITTGLVVVVYSLRRFPNFSLREKLVTAFIAVALIPLVIIVTLSNNVTQSILIEDANQRLLTAARQTAMSVDDFLANSLRTVRTEARLLEGTGYLDLSDDARSNTEIEANALAQLKVFRDKDPSNISSYALLDPRGRTLLEYPLNSVQVDESARDYITVPLETGQAFISPVEFTPVIGGPFIYFSAPVHDETGQVAGVLRAQFKASILQQLITRSTSLVGGQSSAVLLDENYLHLAHGTAPETLFTLVAPMAPERLVELQKQQRIPTLPPGELSTNLPTLARQLDSATEEPFFTANDVATGERIDQVAVTATGLQPWLVAFFQPQNVFLEPIERQTQTAIILSIGVTAAAIVIAVLLAELLTGPIIRLREAAKRVAQGDLSVRARVESDDEIGALARTFNQATSQLQETLLNLEQRVTDRTRALTTSTEVGRRLSTILDQQQLVTEVVEQVQKAFGYYHAHIYLYDELGDNLNMVGGTGVAGQVMLERGHRIERGKGLVGRAAAQNSVVLVPDVKKDPDWLANPLLPETRSEVAVPIAVGDQVLGVLDVQDDEIYSLQQQDADLLLSISNQVAIALQNAGMYVEIQRQAERRAQLNEISRKIQNTVDADKAMQTAVRELGRAVGGRYTRVWLNSPTNGNNGNSSDQEE
jgi:putative methionine-R-sulfoxide reductase with GAF domain